MERERRQQGFTLMELLIVVAIIAVLVAIAIPMFTNQLERSREAADIANMRSARSVAAVAYMTDELTEADGEVYFDGSGTLTRTKPLPYGKGTTADGGAEYDSYDSALDYTSSVICARVDGDELFVYWDAKPVYRYTGNTFGTSAEDVRAWVQKSLSAFESYYGPVSERSYAAISLDTNKYGAEWGGTNNFMRTSRELGTEIPHYGFSLGEWGQNYELDGSMPANATSEVAHPRLYILILDGQVYTNTDPETGQQVDGWVPWK